MDTNFVPNWLAIVSSGVWKDQIEPWLREMRADALEEKAGALRFPTIAAGDMPTIEEYHYWRGFCAALKQIADMPQQFLELNRTLEAEEKKDAIARESGGRRY